MDTLTTNRSKFRRLAMIPIHFKRTFGNVSLLLCTLLVDTFQLVLQHCSFAITGETLMELSIDDITGISCREECC